MTRRNGPAKPLHAPYRIREVTRTRGRRPPRTPPVAGRTGTSPRTRRTPRPSSPRGPSRAPTPRGTRSSPTVARVRRDRRSIRARETGRSSGGNSRRIRGRRERRAALVTSARPPSERARGRGEPLPALDVIAEHVPARAGGASNTCRCRTPSANATRAASSIDSASERGRPSNTVPTSAAELTDRDDPGQRGASHASGDRSMPLASPPAMRTTPSASPTAAIAACRFVAFESSTNRRRRRSRPARSGGAPARTSRAPPASAAVASAERVRRGGGAAASARSPACRRERTESAPLHPAVARAVKDDPPVAAGSPMREPPHLAGGRARARGGRLVVEVPDVDVARTLEHEDPRLRRRVRVERAVPVEVVRREVEQHRDPRLERRR